MAKTLDQRTKLVLAGSSVPSLLGFWNDATSKFKKDLSAAIFLKSGNVVALATRYDKDIGDFMTDVVRLKKAPDLFKPLTAQLDKISDETDKLFGEIKDIQNDTDATVQVGSEDDDPEAVVKEWEDFQKSMRVEDKELKGLFDRWLKLDANSDKLLTDAIAKVKKEVAVAKAGLTSKNNELNSLEDQIKKICGAYSVTATDMNRPDIASAVRGFVASFSVV